MKYAVTTKTITTARSVLDIEVPESLIGSEVAFDRAVYANVRRGAELPTEDETVITTKTTIIEVVRGDKRIYPQPRKSQAKPKVAKDQIAIEDEVE